MARSLVNQSTALVEKVDNMLIEFYLSKTNRLCRARTWTALWIYARKGKLPQSGTEPWTSLTADNDFNHLTTCFSYHLNLKQKVPTRFLCHTVM